MNRALRTLLLGGLAAVGIVKPLGAQEYTLDPKHTYVLWHVDHFGFSHPSGKWVANGTLDWDKDKPTNSKVNVTIKMSDLSTGIPEFDKHLKTKQFFDIAQFPTATFVSNKVEANGDKIHKIHGTLTVHGVSKPVSLDVTPNRIGVNPITEKNTLGFSASTQLKRSDFGLDYFVPDVSDEVKIQIEVEAYQSA